MAGTLFQLSFYLFCFISGLWWSRQEKGGQRERTNCSPVKTVKEQINNGSVLCDTSCSLKDLNTGANINYTPDRREFKGTPTVLFPSRWPVWKWSLCCQNITEIFTFHQRFSHKKAAQSPQTVAGNRPFTHLKVSLFFIDAVIVVVWATFPPPRFLSRKWHLKKLVCGGRGQFALS